MYLTTNYKNFGNIKKVEKLEKNRQYEIIGDIDLIVELKKHYSNLIEYNRNTNTATTNDPETLQTIINNIQGYKNYQFIFI